MRPDVLILGAGAAGLWAAATAARGGARVLVIEKTPRIGTKILASGGSRCNLTTSLPAHEAAELFGPRGARFLQHALSITTPERVREHFHSLGVETTCAPLDKVFPTSGRASDVRDALERDARDAGARFALSSPVHAIEPSSDGWLVHLDATAAHPDKTLHTPHLMLCTGGMSYPRSGTTGDGWRWLRSLELPITPLVPALVGLTSREPWVHELAGVDAPDAHATMHDTQDRPVGSRRRPILFTHRGLSGPGAMDLAHLPARALATRPHDAPEPRYTLCIDLYPDHSAANLDASLRDAASAPGKISLWRALPDGPPRRLLQRASFIATGHEEPPAPQQLSKKARQALIRALKSLPVPIHGTRGFEHAEVTDGGLDLDLVDPHSMLVSGHPNLYVFGELLDLSGPIGGLNFLAAWSCAEIAARHLTSTLQNNR
jgi:predicted Rossmann fold flavoprotein